MNVILIGGKLQSGKNTFANFLKKELRKNGHSVGFESFAKSVKEWSLKDFGPLSKILNSFVDFYMKKYSKDCPIDLTNEVLKLKLVDSNFFEDKTKISRTLLQIYGTEIFRNRVNVDFWIDDFKNRIDKLKGVFDYILVTDVRFKNEICNLQNYDFDNVYTIKIVNNCDRNGPVHSHLSENDLDNFDGWSFIINNVGNVTDLEKKAIDLVKKIVN